MDPTTAMTLIGTLLTAAQFFLAVFAMRHGREPGGRP